MPDAKRWHGNSSWKPTGVVVSAKIGMDTVLLDTDVFSFLSKPGDSRADLYYPYVTAKTIALTFISVGELYVWTMKRKWSSRRIAALEHHLRQILIIPYDLELCREYGRVKSNLASSKVAAANDLWIATCAIRHSIPLLTHNRRHFKGIPRLKVISAERNTIAEPSRTPPDSPNS
jgi:tRNA(fMet)-specific endonuclease VapC